MISGRDQHCGAFFAKLSDSERDRYAHRGGGVLISNERNICCVQLLADLVTAMTDDDENMRHTCVTQVGDGTLEHSLRAKREERLESAHTTRPAGGEHDGGQLLHAKLLLRGGWFPKLDAVAFGIHYPAKLAKLSVVAAFGIDIDAGRA